MKYASDFRAQARAALRGKWIIASLVGFIASLLGGTIATSGSASASSSFGGNGENLNEFLHSDFWYEYRGIIITIGVILLVFILIWSLALAVVSGAAKLGYARYNLHLIDGEKASLSDLVSQFHRLPDGFLMELLRGLYLFLWSLLFVIPAIIKSYSYAMTPYILSENPQMSANDAITESRRLMDGNKWRLFCLEFSFIGWWLLCSLPLLLGLGGAGAMVAISGNPLWILVCLPTILPVSVAFSFLRAYTEAAWAAFYREICQSPLSPDEEQNA